MQNEERPKVTDDSAIFHLPQLFTQQQGPLDPNTHKNTKPNQKRIFFFFNFFLKIENIIYLLLSTRNSRVKKNTRDKSSDLSFLHLSLFESLCSSFLPKFEEFCVFACGFVSIRQNLSSDLGFSIIILKVLDRVLLLGKFQTFEFCFTFLLFLFVGGITVEKSKLRSVLLFNRHCCNFKQISVGVTSFLVFLFLIALFDNCFI